FKFALHVLLMVAGFPLMLSINLAHAGNADSKRMVGEKSTIKPEPGIVTSAVTDDVSFIMRYTGLLI
ncbi:MAG TPA: hypothetical protein VFV68_03325, partial [Agriterribacter sp.]|nr:hypothetical protein [Agriterribacter sp.]